MRSLLRFANSETRKKPALFVILLQKRGVFSGHWLSFSWSLVGGSIPSFLHADPLAHNYNLFCLCLDQRQQCNYFQTETICFLFIELKRGQTVKVEPVNVTVNRKTGQDFRHFWNPEIQTNLRGIFFFSRHANFSAFFLIFQQWSRS